METQAEAAQLLAKSQLERKDEETQELARTVAQLEEHVATTKRLEADTAAKCAELEQQVHDLQMEA